MSSLGGKNKPEKPAPAPPLTVKSLFVIPLVAFLVIVFLFREVFFMTFLEKQVESMTGLRLDVQSAHIDLVKPSVSINGLKLHNPPGFRDKTMMNVPEIYIEIDPISILSGRIHLREVSFHISDFYIIRRYNGTLNLAGLKQSQKADGKQNLPGKGRGVFIDRLDLEIDKIFYKDYTADEFAITTGYDLYLKQSFTNIDGEKSLFELLIFKSLIGTAFQSLSEFDFEAMDSGMSAIKEMMSGAASDGTQETFRNASDGVKKLSESFKKSIEGLFKK